MSRRWRCNTGFWFLFTCRFHSIHPSLSTSSSREAAAGPAAATAIPACRSVDCGEQGQLSQFLPCLCLQAHVCPILMAGRILPSGRAHLHQLSLSGLSGDGSQCVWRGRQTHDSLGSSASAEVRHLLPGVQVDGSPRCPVQRGTSAG